MCEVVDEALNRVRRLSTRCGGRDVGGVAGDPQPRRAGAAGPVFEEPRVGGQPRLHVGERRRALARLQAILPGARAALLDETEQIGDRRGPFGGAKPDERVVHITPVGEEFRSQRQRSQIRSHRLDGCDGALVGRSRASTVAVRLAHAADAVERLPLFLDEARTTCRVERRLQVEFGGLQAAGAP